MIEKNIAKFAKHLEALSELCANDSCDGCPAYDHGCMFINRSIPCCAYNEYLYINGKLNKSTKGWI